MQVYVVLEYSPYNNTTEAINVFQSADKATLFCREKNRNTCHLFYIEEVGYIEGEK